MKITSKVKKFQEGGVVAPEQEMPQEAPVESQEGAQDPMQQILQVAAQAVQSQNCEAAMAVCQALLQLVQGGAEQAPQEPTFAKRGAKLVKVNRRG
jgi:hypothetical protein